MAEEVKTQEDPTRKVQEALVEGFKRLESMMQEVIFKIKQAGGNPSITQKCIIQLRDILVAFVQLSSLVEIQVRQQRVYSSILAEILEEKGIVTTADVQAMAIKLGILKLNEPPVASESERKEDPSPTENKPDSGETSLESPEAPPAEPCPLSPSPSLQAEGDAPLLDSSSR